MAYSTSTHRSSHNSPYAPPRAQIKQPQGGAFMRDRDLAAEGHVMAIGLWTRVFSALGVLGAVLLLATGGGIAAPILVPVIAIACFGVLLGSHLFDLRPWARWGYLVVTVLQLLNLGLGVLTNPGAGQLIPALLGGGWAAAQLWALFGEGGSRVFTEGYRERRDGRRVPYWTSVFFILPAIGLGLLLLAVVFSAVVRL
ncbi:MAG: hypothetical protein R3F62_17080 [Planctomycetota bacterium]